MTQELAPPDSARAAERPLHRTEIAAFFKLVQNGRYR